ncbi:unnamed protein product [Aspergillus oryzae]|uniref:Unnamed protein product n=2 Tax=Aspergillus oryzae TaxID=5062 RepID=A0AAN4YCF7_ASPOZ|nr:unnamed protein product [Aspergillus oryzae]GMF84250.1 unnamed protein product [Aspergillus oryzae]GMG27037.1 unnamed protein product [Aspergillus oryzae]GMG44142.1 unnamed protein product [Aspergillus oryzae var. brunneus]
MRRTEKRGYPDYYRTSCNSNRGEVIRQHRCYLDNQEYAAAALGFAPTFTMSETLSVSLAPFNLSFLNDSYVIHIVMLVVTDFYWLLPRSRKVAGIAR